ncbi:unnamed protein product [Paramecium sonneborni]|uniref:Gamma tubulin complex component C-terminal domain-containing protein n=2 Tax=Paramecium sonneborni TaxID=65129 RepID=A0A8S1ML35_9CILI|nr:unnamed protein product [Paramecium sonneborni]
MSNFQKQREQQFEEDLEKFIIYFTGFVPSQKNFEIAHKYASSNLKYHTFLDPDAHQIQSKFKDILIKLQVMSKPDTADYLNTLFEELKKRKLKQDYNDMPQRILGLLLLLSSNLIEHNLNREPNKNILKGRQQDNISISSIESLKDWKFETSSEEEDDEEQDNRKEQIQINQKQSEIKRDVKEIEQQKQTLTSSKDQLPNVLWHMSFNTKKSFNEFLSSSETSIQIKSSQLFLSENQNKSQEILKKPRIINMIINERDVVIAVLYSFLGLQSELLTFSSGQYQLTDFDVRHMSHESLLSSTQKFLEYATIVCHLKRPLQMIQKPCLLNIEILIQEQFWLGVRSILSEFDQVVTTLLEQSIYDEKLCSQQIDRSITLLYLNQSLQDWFIIIKQINIVAQKISTIEGNIGTFNSPTLTILYNLCIQNSLQPQHTQVYLQKLFLYALEPYIKLLDKYLDYNSTITDSFENLPIFLQNCSIQLKNIGQAFQIFQKVGLPALKQIQFRKNLIMRLCEVSETSPQKSIETTLQYCTLSGGYKFHEPFTLTKLKQRETQIQEKESYSIKDINNTNLIKVFQKEIVKLIKKEDQNIQNILLDYLNNHLHFVKLHKYLRCLFFFERVDLMQQFIQQIAESQSLARLRAIQNTIQDLLGKNFNFQNAYELQPQLICQQNSQFLLSHKSVNFKIFLPHPIDLIINENALILYNKIMQFLLFFKNSKLHLQQSLVNLKKRFKNFLSKFLHFGNQLTHFITNYEYFLFISILQVQTDLFLDKVNKSQSFQEIIDNHNLYLKTISDKMFLNQKSESILDAIYKVIDIVQNYPMLIDRVTSLDLVDQITKKIETMRIENEFTKMKDSFNQQISALILLFDHYTQRFTHAPEIIECILKVNFNQFYK